MDDILPAAEDESRDNLLPARQKAVDGSHPQYVQAVFQSAGS